MWVLPGVRNFGLYNISGGNFHLKVGGGGGGGGQKHAAGHLDLLTLLVCYV